ncbi:LacI family DNA-binding transcriptional regulator [Enterococcus sulfureus]
MKNYSIKDIAELSGVSVATVSRVINDNGRFSEQTKQKVLKVIEETGYNINYSAKSLRMKKSFTIGIIVPDIQNYFFSDIVQKIEKILFELNYSTIICNTGRDHKKEKSYIQMLKGRDIDGLIVISGVEKFSLDSIHNEKSIPYICIDREPLDKSDTIFISSDHFSGAYMATQHLIDQHCLHPICAFENANSTSTAQRIEGFKRCLEDNSILFDKENSLLQVSVQNLHNEEQLFPKLNKNNVDGIFAVNDYTASHLMLNLNKKDSIVPKKIKLIGFDGSPVCEFTNPSLSSIHQDTEKIAILSVEYLINLINKKTSYGQTKIVPVDLIIRKSTEMNNNLC